MAETVKLENVLILKNKYISKRVDWFLNKMKEYSKKSKEINAFYTNVFYGFHGSISINYIIKMSLYIDCNEDNFKNYIDSLLEIIKYNEKDKYLLFSINKPPYNIRYDGVMTDAECMIIRCETKKNNKNIHIVTNNNIRMINYNNELMEKIMQEEKFKNIIFNNQYANLVILHNNDDIIFIEKHLYYNCLNGDISTIYNLSYIDERKRFELVLNYLRLFTDITSKDNIWIASNPKTTSILRDIMFSALLEYINIYHYCLSVNNYKHIPVVNPYSEETYKNIKKIINFAKSQKPTGARSCVNVEYNVARIMTWYYLYTGDIKKTKDKTREINNIIYNNVDIREREEVFDSNFTFFNKMYNLKDNTMRNRNIILSKMLWLALEGIKDKSIYNKNIIDVINKKYDGNVDAFFNSVLRYIHYISINAEKILAVFNEKDICPTLDEIISEENIEKIENNIYIKENAIERIKDINI